MGAGEGRKEQGWQPRGKSPGLGFSREASAVERYNEQSEVKFAEDRGTVQCLGHFRESLDLLEPVLTAEIPHRGRAWIATFICTLSQWILVDNG